MTERLTYLVKMCSGLTEELQADQVTYDDTGNLMFLNFKKTIQTQQNPGGQAVELVKCFNHRHYESYCLKPSFVKH